MIINNFNKKLAKIIIILKCFFLYIIIMKITKLNIFLLTFLFFCIIIILFYNIIVSKYKNKIKHEINKQNILKNNLNIEKIKNKYLNNKHNTLIKDSIDQNNSTNINKLVNPLLPPTRSHPRSYSYNVNFRDVGIPINVPTRGYANDFQQIGLLVDKSTNETLPLFGRQLYNGSSKWWYYTLSNQQNSVKLPISHKNRNCESDFGCDELYDGDYIDIPILNKKMSVSLYKFDKPRYIPF